MLNVKQLTIWVTLLVGVTFSCTPDDQPGSQPDNFDRKAMLSHWADDFIIPGYENYHQKLLNLKASAQDFVSSPTVASHTKLYADFTEAYHAWQWVSKFDIGPAERIGLHHFTNIYPADTTGIENAVQSQNYNLKLPSTFVQQGFPALDYLLAGKGNAQATAALFNSNSSYGDYLLNLVTRQQMLTKEVLDEWKNTYRNAFVENDGSSATASVNKMANDYVFHHEKELRAGKIGIPAGVFSGSTLPHTIEAFYSDTLAKSLFLESLEAHRKFFAGEGFEGNPSGNSFKAYLDYLGVQKDGKNLSDKILDQFEVARISAEGLPDNFADAVTNQRQDMLGTYDELQKNVVMLKVDMLQALNVKVDYVDADGD